LGEKPQAKESYRRFLLRRRTVTKLPRPRCAWRRYTWGPIIADISPMVPAKSQNTGFQNKVTSPPTWPAPPRAAPKMSPSTGINP